MRLPAKRHPIETGSWSVALCGLAALAVAMGIGRFAFTPILPMMQEDLGVTIAQGSWLASANYLGYLIGALSAMRGEIRQGFAIRMGLLIISLTTIAMGFVTDFTGWIALRVLPGIASAWVLVHISSWALERLGKAHRADLGGTVYTGVGAGIVFAGGVCLLLAHLPSAATDAWIAMGITALCVTAAVWRRVGGGEEPRAGASTAKSSPREIPEFWRLVFCQGALGLGYIIPATFLPVIAKQMIADPHLFGWAWPVFGAAAVASTLLAARLSRIVGQRRLWILGNLVMAAGMLVPIVLPGLAGVAIAALCVGGTFMVITMAGFQEARRVAGAHARVLMAAMTSAFALGQITGPLLVSGFVAMQFGFAIPLVAAASALVLAAYVLLKGEIHESNRSHAPSAAGVPERGAAKGH